MPRGESEWLFGVSTDPHSGIKKKVPSRQNGKPLRGMKGPAKNAVSNAIKSGGSGAASIHNMLNDREKHPDLAPPTRKQIQSFIECAPPSLKTSGTATHDLINWHLPKLAVDAASLSKFSNDDDIVIIAEPMIRKVAVPKHDPLGKKIVNEKNKIVCEEKKVHCFLTSTVGLLKMLKKRAEICTKIACDIDGAHGLTKDGWVFTSAAIACIRFDEKRQRYCRGAFTPVWKLHYSECHLGHVYFLHHIKNLPKTHFGMDAEFEIVMECQDRANHMQTAVKEVFPNCLSGTCNVHINRKFDDGTVGRRLRLGENVDVIKVHVSFLMLCKTRKMFNYHYRLFFNFWKHVLNEAQWADSFARHYLSDDEWFSNWFVSAFNKPGMVPHANVVENTHMSEQKAIIEKVDKNKPVGHFVENGLRSITRNATSIAKNKETFFGIDLLKPTKKIITGNLFMAAASWKEQWGNFAEPQHAVLSEMDKKILIEEPALFKGFFDAETKDVSQLDIVIFNKTIHGMDKPLTQAKTSAMLKCLLGKGSVKSHPTKTEIDFAIKFGNSFGVVAVKVGCSDENRNDLICSFATDPTINMWVRSITKCFYTSSCVDSDVLLVLDLLGTLSLEHLMEKVTARRKTGKPAKVNSIITFIRRHKTANNKVELLVEFMRKNNFASLLDIFSYQIMRSYNGRHHTSVIHSYAHDKRGKINGVVIWYPLCNHETPSGKERSEEIISIDDLAFGIFESEKCNNFKPWIGNKNNQISSESAEEIGARYCKCKLKAAVKKTLSNKKGNKGKMFYCCPKDKNNPSNCKFFNWKRD